MPLRVAVLGASGYTGVELLRLLVAHPHVHIAALSAEKNAGQTLQALWPQFVGKQLPVLQKIDQIDFAEVDCVFCALPHGLTQAVVRDLPKHLRIIDLSADFRLKNIDDYAAWYGHVHEAPQLQAEAVYGLSEIYRHAIRRARLVANPGCYPTSAQLPLIPLLREKLVAGDAMIIDSKSGVSGAGREAKMGSLFCEVTEGIHAYGVASHRHAPEIDQGLSEAAGYQIVATFTPHLMPMSRGILSTIYVSMTRGVTVEHIHHTLRNTYANSPFVHVLPPSHVPQTRHVRGTNHAHIGVVADRGAGRAIIVSVIDNLMKGASGQAVQNMNIMYDWPEETALQHVALFP